LNFTTLSSCSSCPAQATLATALLTPVSYPGSSVISVPSRLTCPGCLSSQLVKTVLSRLSFLAVLSRMSSPSCPVRVFLSQMSCPKCYVPDVLSQLARLLYPGCPVLADLFLLSYSGRSATVSYPGCTTVYHLSFCPSSPVPAFLSWLSCPSCLVKAVGLS
jgi:hypothetical protein